MSETFLSADTPEGKTLVNRVLYISILINLFLVIATILIGLNTGIQSLILDGVHSSSDLFSDVLLLLAFPFIYKKKDDSHHFGHTRYEDVLSLVIGMMIIISAVPFIIYSIKALFLQQVSTLDNSIWAWIITILTIILKEMLYHITNRIGKKTNSPMLIANSIHHRSDVFSSILVLGVLLGINIGFPIIDSIVSICMGLYLCVAGIKISLEAIHILSDRAPEKESKLVSDILQKVPDIFSLHNLRLRQSGPFLIGEVHIELDYRLTIVEAHDIIKEAQVLLRSTLPQLREFTIHVDPYYD